MPHSEVGTDNKSMLGKSESRNIIPDPYSKPKDIEIGERYEDQIIPAL